MKPTHANQAKKIGYVRAASRNPDGNNALLEQISRIQAAGANTIICDFAPASDNHREGLEILLKLAKEGQIDKVLVTRLDLLSRISNRYDEVLNVFEAASTEIRLLDQDEIDPPFSWGDLWGSLSPVAQEQECQSGDSQTLNLDLSIEKNRKGRMETRESKIWESKPKTLVL
jgi:predicted site-specific integrase-resolvase